MVSGWSSFSANIFDRVAIFGLCRARGPNLARRSVPVSHGPKAPGILSLYPSQNHRFGTGLHRLGLRRSLAYKIPEMVPPGLMEGFADA